MSEPTLQRIYAHVVYESLTSDPPRTPDEDGLRAIAVPLWLEGRTDEAITCLDMLERRKALSANDLCIRGFWKLDRMHWSEARLDFLSSLEMKPDHDWARFGYGYALFLSAEYESAATEFQALIDEGTVLKGPQKMARAARTMASGQQLESVELSPLPDLPPGMSETMQIRRRYGSEPALEHALRVAREIPIPHDLPLLRLALELAIRANKNEVAFELWIKLHERAPEHGLTALLGGFALARNGNLEHSHRAFEYATKVAPLYASAWGGYGAGLMQRNDIEGAVKAFRIAIFLDESNASFWSDLGQAYLRRDDHKEAFRCLKKAKEHGNLSFDVYLQCGVCAAELNDEVTALENWGLAVKSNPDHPKVPQVLSLASICSQGDKRFIFDAYTAAKE